MTDSITQIMVVVLCLGMSFFLSGMEAGALALNRLRIRQLMRTGDKKARVLLGFIENPENFICTILVGNTLANFFGVFLVAAGLHYHLGEHPMLFWPAFALFVFFLYGFADLLPKILFQAFPNRLCLSLTTPFRWVHFALSPLVSLVTWCARLLLRWTGGTAFSGRLFGNREELRLLMQENAASFSTEERAMINRVMDFQNFYVRHVAIPMDKVVKVAANTPMHEVVRLCREHQLTRLLVEQEVDKRRRVLGLVSMKTAIYRADLDLDKTAGDYVKPAIYLDEHLGLEEALWRIQRSGQRLAVVLDSNWQECGIISLEDILRVLFGELKL